jgi:hypothetical protein
MGAKYQPTIKDIQAAQRYQQKQNALRKLKKPAADQPAQKNKKK